MLTPVQAAKIRKNADNLSEEGRRYRTEGQSHHEKNQADLAQNCFDQAIDHFRQAVIARKGLDTDTINDEDRWKTLADMVAIKDIMVQQDQPIENVPNDYQLFGVPRDADANGIKKAYYKLQLFVHSDKREKMGDRAGESEACSKALNKAYETLSDSKKREKYDFFFRDAGFDFSPPEDARKKATAQPKSGSQEAKNDDIEWTIEVGANTSTVKFSTSTAIILTTKRSLYDLFTQANYSSQDIRKLCEENVNFAFAVFQDPRLNQKLSYYDWQDIALAHEEVALRLCQPDKKGNIYVVSNTSIAYKIAKNMLRFAC